MTFSTFPRAILEKQLNALLRTHVLLLISTTAMGFSILELKIPYYR